MYAVVPLGVFCLHGMTCPARVHLRPSSLMAAACSMCCVAPGDSAAKEIALVVSWMCIRRKNSCYGGFFGKCRGFLFPLSEC